jgi:hypothetical protein
MLRQRGWFLVVFEHVSLSSLHGDAMRSSKEGINLFAREYKRIDLKPHSFCRDLCVSHSFSSLRLGCENFII